MDYTQHFSTTKTPQTQAIPGKEHLQTKNSAGGFSFKVDPFMQLDRFLILGTEGGSFYASERELTIRNAKNVVELIKQDGMRVLNRTVEVSQRGLAPKNDQAIFVMALLCAFGSPEVKQATYARIKDVCRIGTHIFNFCQNIKGLRKWSHGLRRGVSKFYESRNEEQLALQFMKYRQRNGWTHKDVISLSHPKIKTGVPMVYDVLGKKADENKPIVGTMPESYQAYLTLQKLDLTEKSDMSKAVNLILDHKLPWEVVPTEHLNKPAIWEALIPSIGLTALMRNLNRLTKIGLLTDHGFDDFTKWVIGRFQDMESIKISRLHPLSILNAMRAYDEGDEYKPIKKITDALEDAFYLAFGNIEPSGKRILLGLDVSDSMTWSKIAGTKITPREASAVLAMVTARSEENYYFMGFGQEFRRISITKKSTLNEAIQTIQNVCAGGTDCALPMVWAKKHKVPVDVFSVYTDSETFYGNIHPTQALSEYRQAMGIDAKLVVVGMVANKFTIADPTDPRQLDVVGFSLDTPQVISSFARG